MTGEIKQRLIQVAVLAIIIKPSKVQIAMPMYMPAAVPQPVYAMQAPIAVAIQLPEPVTKTTTTTTTTQSPNIALALPVPVPMPVQIAVPAQPPPVFCQGNPRPKSCPPCPPCLCMPSCTPSFFSYCSPCHMKCRCRSPGDAPVPMPPNPPVPFSGPVYPMPVPVAQVPLMGPPPVVVVPLPPSKPFSAPLPPRRRRRPKCRFLQSDSSSSSTSDDTSNSCDSSSRSSGYYRPKKFKRRRTQIYRRNAGIKSDSSDSELVKPVVSYVSENGNIQFKTKISSKEALDLLENRRTINSDGETIKLKANENSVVVLSNHQKPYRRNNKVYLRDSPVDHMLGEGKNELVFKPPAHKRINNVAVSFQVT